MGTSYQLVVEIAQRIEGYRQRGREKMQHEKRVCYSQEFRGAPVKGRAPQGPSSGYFGHQGSSSAYFSAMPDRSYRPPAIQGSSDGYSVHQCQTSGQQITEPRGSTYSYVSSMFAHFLDIPCGSLGSPVYVSTPVGDSIVVDRIYRPCVVTFCGYETRMDLLLLDMTDFEDILGMDWLSPYHDILDCHGKTITLATSELPRLEWKGSSVSTSSQVISFMKAQHMVRRLISVLTWL
ncbi:uncharacterized protein [Nicotiana tomentosiformis]|uniref:uncharacterized protein n=1 Tax=Nicotiana tomentosiformis TaxID=4098 RepID=UPI00388CE0F4